MLCICTTFFPWRLILLTLLISPHGRWNLPMLSSHHLHGLLAFTSCHTYSHFLTAFFLAWSSHILHFLEALPSFISSTLPQSFQLVLQPCRLAIFPQTHNFTFQMVVLLIPNSFFLTIWIHFLFQDSGLDLLFYVDFAHGSFSLYLYIFSQISLHTRLVSNCIYHACTCHLVTQAHIPCLLTHPISLFISILTE